MRGTASVRPKTRACIKVRKHMAPNEDLLTEHLTLVIPRLCHNA